MAFNRNNPVRLIDLILKKSENIKEYINRASNNMHPSDYEKIEEIIKNDQRMLRYLQCEKILDPQNSHLEQHRETYQSCLKNLENIKKHIHEIRNPSQIARNQSYTPDRDNKPKPKQERNFDLDF